MPSPATAEPDLSAGPPVSTPAKRNDAADWASSLPPLGQELVAAAKSGKSVTEAAEKATNEKPSEVKVETAAPAAAAPAAAKKAADAAPENPEKRAEVDEVKWPRNATDWEKHKAATAEKIKVKDAEISQLKARVTEYEKRKPDAPDPMLDTLKAERDQLSEQLRITNIENHPKFKAYYTNKVNAQIEMAKRIVGKEQADKIASLLALPESAYRDEQINALTGELPVMQQSRLGSVLNALEEIKAERDGEITRAKSDYEKLSAAEKTNAEKARTEALSKAQKAFTDTLAQAQDSTNGLFTFQLRDGDDAWNKGVTERIESAKSLLFGKADPNTMIRAALYATSLPAVLSSHKQLLEENEHLKATIKSLSSATPKVKPGSSDKPVDDKTPTTTNKPGVSESRKIGMDWFADLQKARQSAMEGESGS